MSIQLRPIQENAINSVRQAFSTGSKAIILQAVTGYGKTLVAAFIAQSAAARGNRILFLAHQDILLRQMSNKLVDFGVRHGTIMAGFTPNHYAHVQVASVQTMVRRIRKFRYEFELIIIDEAHRSISNSYREVLNAIPGAKVLGITGTPQRLDGRGLGVDSGGIYDKLITTESVQEMIELGYLVRPEYYASREKLDLSGVKSEAGESGYDDEALADVVDTPKITGSAVEHYKEIVMGQPALTWCINIDHAEHTAAQFNAAGIPSIVLSGNSTADERQRGLARLAKREVLNVCFAQLLVEGVDVPSLRALIMLRPTKSLTAYLQVCGRSLRIDPLDPSKKSSTILDHAGLAFTHGLCNEDREWSLEGRPKKKKKDQDRLSLMSCPHCYYIFEKAELVNDSCCPHCGKEIVKKKPDGPEYTEGKLEKITEEMAALMMDKRRRQRHNEVRNARTLEQLQAIGKSRGYDPKWASIQWSFKQRAQERAKERWGM